MKKIIFLVLLIVNTIFSQEDLLQYLDGDNLQEKFEVLIYLESNKLTEYIPVIQSRIKNQNQLGTQLRFIDAIGKLGSTEFESEILLFHSRIDDFPSTENKMKFKALAAITLINCCNNYELSYSVVDLAELNNAATDALAVSHLGKIAKNVEELRARSLVQLERLIAPENDELDRMRAMNAICEIVGVDYADELIEILENEPIDDLRFRALNLLNDVKYPGFKDFLKENISQEPDTFIRKEYLSYLFGKFGEPTVIKFIIEYRNTETNPEVLSYIEFGLEAFSPQPKITFIPELSDSLLSYCDQLYQFGWIKDQSNYNQYKAKTEILRELFQHNKIQDVCSNLNWIISEAESQRGSNSLTEEGYKFLFYYTGYIKEKIEKEFSACK